MIAETVKLFIGAIFAVDDECLMFGDVVFFAEIFENRRNRRFKPLAEKFAADVFVLFVLTCNYVEGPLPVAGFDAFERTDLHVVEESASVGEFLTKIRAVGVIGIDCFAAANTTAETKN